MILENCTTEPNSSVTNFTIAISTQNVGNGTTIDAISVEISYVIVSILFVSIILSFVILLTIYRLGTESFFKKKIFDRFTVYNVICDLLLYISLLTLAVFWGVRGFYPRGILCTVLGVTIVLLSVSQTLITTTTAVLVYFLVVHNRQLGLGKYDWILYVAVFGFPLVLFTAMAVWNESQRHLEMCNLRENNAFSSWHFGLPSVSIIMSFVVITALYCRLFGYAWWRRRQATNVLQNSAVNTTRLAVKLSMYVVAHFVQFVLSAMESFFHDPPIEIFRAVAICTVAGGILNAVVYFTLRKK